MALGLQPMLWPVGPDAWCMACGPAATAMACGLWTMACGILAWPGLWACSQPPRCSKCPDELQPLNPAVPHGSSTRITALCGLGFAGSSRPDRSSFRGARGAYQSHDSIQTRAAASAATGIEMHATRTYTRHMCKLWLKHGWCHAGDAALFTAAKMPPNGRRCCACVVCACAHAQVLPQGLPKRPVPTSWMDAPKMGAKIDPVTGQHIYRPLTVAEQKPVKLYSSQSYGASSELVLPKNGPANSSQHTPLMQTIEAMLQHGAVPQMIPSGLYHAEPNLQPALVEAGGQHSAAASSRSLWRGVPVAVSGRPQADHANRAAVVSEF